jgi:hypothetical protein
MNAERVNAERVNAEERHATGEPSPDVRSMREAPAAEGPEYVDAEDK